MKHYGRYPLDNERNVYGSTQVVASSYEIIISSPNDRSTLLSLATRDKLRAAETQLEQTDKHKLLIALAGAVLRENY